MAQHDYVVANQSGLSFRQDLNNALLAIVSQNSGSSAPSTTYAYQWWIDTGVSPALLKLRNAANSAWLVVGDITAANLGLLPSATAASTYAPLTGTGASGTWPISISGNAATATTATTATTLSGTGSLNALDYSYTADFPSVRPSLLLDFANSKALDPRVSFSRASTGTYVGADGLIKTAAINEPRFDHNPSTGESLGLLIEESRTNLLTYSEQFDNAAWTKSAATITANNIAAPDGNTTADLLREDTSAAALRSVVFSVTYATGYTFSIYAKLASGSRKLYVNSGGMRAAFDLSTGTIVLSDSSSVGTASITPAANGWYRCSVYLSGTVGTNSVTVALSQATGSTYGPSYTGDGTSGAYIWGAQLEAGAFPTSYIPTTTATVTRSADVAQMTGTNFSSWYNQNEGTALITASSRGSSAGNYLLVLNPPGDGGSVYASLAEADSSVGVGVYNSSAIYTASLSTSGFGGAGSSRRAALALKAGNYGAALNGTASTTGTSTSAIPTFDKLSIMYFPGYGSANGAIARLAYYPVRLTNAQLQNLTAN